MYPERMQSSHACMVVPRGAYRGQGALPWLLWTAAHMHPSDRQAWHATPPQRPWQPRPPSCSPGCPPVHSYPTRSNEASSQQLISAAFAREEHHDCLQSAQGIRTGLIAAQGLAHRWIFEEQVGSAMHCLMGARPGPTNTESTQKGGRQLQSGIQPGLSGILGASAQGMLAGDDRT